jgi:hypothetical protein
LVIASSIPQLPISASAKSAKDPRKAVSIVPKFRQDEALTEYGYEHAVRGFDASLRKLGPDHVDAQPEEARCVMAWTMDRSLIDCAPSRISRSYLYLDHQHLDVATPTGRLLPLMPG